MVPVVLNTYYPPNQPSPRRCYRLGQAIREAIESYPETCASASWRRAASSHFTVDEELDREVIRALSEKDADALQGLPRKRLNSGNSEIRNWICAGGALEHLDLRWVTYCPGYPRIGRHRHGPVLRPLGVTVAESVLRARISRSGLRRGHRRRGSAVAL